MLQLPSLTYTKVSWETFHEQFCILHDYSLMHTSVFMHMPECVCVQCVWNSLISIVCAYCTHVGRHTERMYRQIFLNMCNLYTQLAMHLEFFALIKLVQCSVATLWTFHFLVKKKQEMEQQTTGDGINKVDKCLFVAIKVSIKWKLW